MIYHNGEYLRVGGGGTFILGGIVLDSKLKNTTKDELSNGNTDSTTKYELNNGNMSTA